MVTHPWDNCYRLDHVRICGELKVKRVFSSCGFMYVLYKREIICNVYHLIIYALSILEIICPVYAGEVEVAPKKNTWKDVTGTFGLNIASSLGLYPMFLR